MPSNTNFVSYSDMSTLMTAIGNKFSALTGAYIPRGTSAFASLPATLTQSMLGYVYNVSDAFTTDSRFVEGSGKDYPAGSNVVVIDADTTGSSPDYKFDVLGGFVDLSEINTAIAAIKAMIAGTFSTSDSYSVGDVVIHENGLYKFTTAHAAGAWDGTEVAATTVDELIQAAITSATSAATAAVNTAKSTVESTIAPEFSAANAYSIGDTVYHEDGLYTFTSAHTAGDPWDSTEVSSTTVSNMVDNAEPESLTPQQISDLEALLG